MAGKRKTVSRGFDYRQCDDFAAYLNHMARQGWHFQEWRAGLVFEQGQPEDAVYAVEVFSGATEYDVRPEPETREFAEYCEAAGWKFIDAKRKLCIFKRIRPDAVPIMTDSERLENIAGAEQKGVWHHLILAAVWVGMCAFEFSSYSFANNIFSNTSLLVTGTWLLLLIASLGRAIHFYIWKYRMRSRIQQGYHVHFGKNNPLGAAFSSVYNWISISGCILYLLGWWYFGQSRMVLFFFGYLGVILLMGYLISRFRPDADINAIIQTVIPLVLFIGLMVVSLFHVYNSNAKLREPQQIPLHAEDIRLDYGEMKSSTGYITSSIFGTHTAYSISYQDRHTLFYVAYQTEADWILDRLWEMETRGAANTNRTDCTASWGADIGFVNGNDKYYIRYPDSILIFTLYEDFVPTSEQITIILDKLGIG